MLGLKFKMPILLLSLAISCPLVANEYPVVGPDDEVSLVDVHCLINQSIKGHPSVAAAQHPFANVNLIGLTTPVSIVHIDVWAKMRSNGVEINLTDIGASYLDDKIAFNTSIAPNSINYVM